MTSLLRLCRFEVVGLGKNMTENSNPRFSAHVSLFPGQESGHRGALLSLEVLLSHGSQILVCIQITSRAC